MFRLHSLPPFTSSTNHSFRAKTNNICDSGVPTYPKFSPDSKDFIVCPELKHLLLGQLAGLDVLQTRFLAVGNHVITKCFWISNKESFISLSDQIVLKQDIRPLFSVFPHQLKCSRNKMLSLTYLPYFLVGGGRGKTESKHYLFRPQQMINLLSA